MNPRVAIFVQARMGSTRLPGKVLLDLGGESMLSAVVKRCRASKRAADVVVLTSTLPEDEQILAWCEREGVAVFLGAAFDVLLRFADATRLYHPEIVVRITADCPLTDPAVIDECVDLLVANEGCDYAATRLPDRRTYPIGLDVEAFWRDGLLRAEREAKAGYQREHVTPWFYDGSFEGKLSLLSTDIDAGNERWTVDTPADLAFIRAIWPHVRSFEWREVLAFLDAHPDLRDINCKISQKKFWEAENR